MTVSVRPPWLVVQLHVCKNPLRVTQVDWNLLNALDVLLAEGSVTAAAERLHLSVPAMSRTLGRIRRAFDDPILVRAGRGLVPTERALAIQDQLHQLVEQAHALLETGRDLDLASLRRVFTVRANDSLTALLAAPLVARVRAAAPLVTARFVAEGAEDLAPLRNGDIDIDIGRIEGLGPEVRVQPLFTERMVGLVAPGHPLATGTMTLRRLTTVDHIVVSRRGRLRGPFDDVLAEQGLTRTVVTSVPTYTAAAHIVLGSALTGLFIESYARSVAARTGAHLFDVPADLPPVAMAQAWHVRHDLDPAHRWLRGQIAAVFGELRRSPDPDRPIRELPPPFAQKDTAP
jgi:DNA-binding transcriptional LysR family regulator